MADKKVLSVVVKAVNAMSPTIAVINKQMRGLNRSINTIGNAGSNLSNKLGIPLSLFGVSALGGIGATMSGFADKAEELQNAVKKVGGTAQDLQVFRKAAEMANIPTEVLDKGLTKLNKNIAEGAAGKSKDFAGLMQKLRIPLRNANGQLRSAGEILPQVADAFEKNTNAAVRARMAAVLFGTKMGAELIPLLADGSVSIREVRERLASLGAVMSDTAIRDGAKLENSLKWLKIAGRGLGNTIGAQLAPALTPLVERFTAWVAVNRELVASRVKDFVMGFARAVERFDWNAFAAGAEKFGNVIGKLVDLIGGWGNAMIALAVIFNASIIVSILEIGFALARMVPAIYAVGTAFTAFAAANAILLIDIIAIAAAIGAVAYLAYKIYENWEPIKAFFVNLWDDITRVFRENIARLVTMIVPFAGILDKVTGGGVTAAINNFVGYTPPGGAAAGGGGGLATAGAQRVNGSIDVRFANAPFGMRASEGQSNTPGFGLNPDVGYSSFATGAP